MWRANKVFYLSFVWCAVAGAQQPGPAALNLPGVQRKLEVGPAGAAVSQPPRPHNPADDYGNRREAAVAALRAGNDAMNVSNNRGRALGMFILAIQRDPSYGRALFNLGVMSARVDRWEEALSFYREAERVDPSMAKIVAAETSRVGTIARLESSADGKRRRRFDLELSSIVARFGDPAIALDSALRLSKTDVSRWEAPAVAGMMHASLGNYEESTKSMEAAARLAPPDRRGRLTTAAELARREAQYLRMVKEGDSAVQKKQFEIAGKLYADAWGANPAQVQTGMQSAVSFLMADQIPLAVQTLSILRQTGTADVTRKAELMLKELAAISPDAKAASESARSGEPATPFDVADRIRTSVGEVRTEEMKLSTAGHPPLLGDDLQFIAINDSDLASQAYDLLLVSTQSLYGYYESRVANRAPRPYMAPDAGPMTPAAVEPAPAPSGTGDGPLRGMPARPGNLETRPDPYTPKNQPVKSPSQGAPAAGNSVMPYREPARSPSPRITA